VDAGTVCIELPSFSLRTGDWILLRPAQELLGADLAMATARVLATLDEPLSGTVELFGHALQSASYEQLLQLRTRLALVPSFGGLLSNRTLRENVALPISVHAGLTQPAEAARVSAILQRFELEPAAELYPHAVSGSTRVRTCVARATALEPELFIVEGAGEFVSETNVGLSWARLSEIKARRGAALVVCVSRPDDDFEAWFRAQGGSVLQYQVLSASCPLVKGPGAT
jgi:predicted ABC-type transport system involved in lysophospholipase L1 biosynthesis ATPase subunit